MNRNFDITVRHENGELRTHVTLLPQDPSGKRKTASAHCEDTLAVAAFKAEGVTTQAEFIGRDVAILIADLLETDAEDNLIP